MMDNPKTIKLNVRGRQNNRLKRLAMTAALMNLVGLRGGLQTERYMSLLATSPVKFHEVGGKSGLIKWLCGRLPETHTNINKIAGD